MIKLKNKTMDKKNKNSILGMMNYICKIITPKNQHLVKATKKIKNITVIYCHKMIINILTIFNLKNFKNI